MLGLSTVLIVVLIFAITTAWYNNVIHSDGLHFQASPWGFEGSVEVGNSIITAAPGTSGAIPLTVTNPTDQVMDVSVGISKLPIAGNSEFSEMQKHIYFYADDAKIINGENVDRIYINQRSNYNYTLLAGQTLSSGQVESNNAAIKWEWVYDVVGYYVLGTVADSGSPVIEDYLRPVIYDYDRATFDSQGRLLTVDGSTSEIDFLSELSKTDGYPGILSKDEKAVNGYYPIEVNQDGYGVWVYLCKRGEIEFANAVDTMLAEAIAKEDNKDAVTQFSATLNIIGQQKKLTVREAASVDAFTSAFADPECDMVELMTDILINSETVLPEGRELIIDLNGHTVTTTVEGDMICVNPGASLAFLDGKIAGQGTSNYAFAVRGGDLTLTGIETSNIYSALYLQDQYGQGNDSQVVISRCKLESTNQTLAVMGNGLGSERMTRLVVEDSEIISKNYIGISGNGTATGDGCWGTDIFVNGSTVSGLWGGIYHPQRDSRLHVLNSTVKGYTGIAVKAGHVIVEDSIVSGEDPTDSISPSTPAFSKSGYTDTGDGVYVETNYGWEITVEIKGDKTKVTSEEGRAVEQYALDAANSHITVTGGSFSHDIGQFVSDGYTCTKTDDLYKVTKS